MAYLQFLGDSKVVKTLISRKIGMAENLLNFHTVIYVIEIDYYIQYVMK